MRIVGEISDPKMKITILEMNHRINLKFEFGLMEQTYKLTHQIEGNVVHSIESLLTDEVRSDVMQQFSNMSSLKRSFVPPSRENDEFPVLI